MYNQYFVSCAPSVLYTTDFLNSSRSILQPVKTFRGLPLDEFIATAESDIVCRQVKSLNGYDKDRLQFLDFIRLTETTRQAEQSNNMNTMTLEEREEWINIEYELHTNATARIDLVAEYTQKFENVLNIDQPVVLTILEDVINCLTVYSIPFMEMNIQNAILTRHHNKPLVVPRTSELVRMARYLTMFNQFYDIENRDEMANAHEIVLYMLQNFERIKENTQEACTEVQRCRDNLNICVTQINLVLATTGSWSHMKIIAQVPLFESYKLETLKLI